MPWTAQDASKHKANLTDSEKSKWASIANAVLKDCEKSNGTDCEGKAIRIANSKIDQ